MKSLLLLFLTALVSLPQAANALVDGPLPQRELWRKVLNSRVDIFDRARVIQLAELLPTLYGFHFVCQFQSGARGAAPLAVLPGEWLEAPDGGSLRCPEAYELMIEKQTRLRIIQEGVIPHFVLSQGSATITFPQVSFFLDTAGLETAVLGTGKEQVLTVSASPDGSSLDCDRGALSMKMATREATGKNLIRSRDCRIAVTIDESAITRIVAANDEIEARNIALPRRFWPSATGAKARPGASGVNLLIGLQITVTPSANVSAPFAGTWIIQRAEPAIAPEVSCTVFGQRNEMETPLEIVKFKSGTLAGSFTVDPTYRQGFVSMVCDTDKVTLASNLLDLGQFQALSQ